MLNAPTSSPFSKNRMPYANSSIAGNESKAAGQYNDLRNILPSPRFLTQAYNQL